MPSTLVLLHDQPALPTLQSEHQAQSHNTPHCEPGPGTCPSAEQKRAASRRPRLCITWAVAFRNSCPNLCHPSASKSDRTGLPPHGTGCVRSNYVEEVKAPGIHSSVRCHALRTVVGYREKFKDRCAMWITRVGSDADRPPQQDFDVQVRCQCPGTTRRGAEDRRRSWGPLAWGDASRLSAVGRL